MYATCNFIEKYETWNITNIYNVIQERHKINVILFRSIFDCMDALEYILLVIEGLLNYILYFRRFLV